MAGMKWPFSRSDKHPDPGIAGIARVDSSVARVLRRVEPGDIVVINEPDLTQAAAEDLIAAGVVGVINASPALSHTYPTYGTLVLLQAGVAVETKPEWTSSTVSAMARHCRWMQAPSG